jgi:hypothetical protein
MDYKVVRQLIFTFDDEEYTVLVFFGAKINKEQRSSPRYWLY